MAFFILSLEKVISSKIDLRYKKFQLTLEQLSIYIT